jgi:hypothetical protein
VLKTMGAFVAGVLVALSVDVAAQRSFGFMSAGEFISAATAGSGVSAVRDRLEEARRFGYVIGIADGLKGAILLLVQDGKTDGAKRLAATAQCVSLRGESAGALLENAKAILRSHSNRNDNAAAVILERACGP